MNQTKNTCNILLTEGDKTYTLICFSIIFKVQLNFLICSGMYQEMASSALNGDIMVQIGIFWTIGEYSYFGLLYYDILSKDRGL